MGVGISRRFEAALDRTRDVLECRSRSCAGESFRVFLADVRRDHHLSGVASTSVAGVDTSVVEVELADAPSVATVAVVVTAAAAAVAAK